MPRVGVDRCARAMTRTVRGNQVPELAGLEVGAIPPWRRRTHIQVGTPVPLAEVGVGSTMGRIEEFTRSKPICPLVGDTKRSLDESHPHARIARPTGATSTTELSRHGEPPKGLPGLVTP